MNTIDTCIHDHDPGGSDFEVTWEICQVCEYYEVCAVRISKPEGSAA
jgi:hypothetical protein